MSQVLVRCSDQRLNEPLQKKYAHATILSQTGGIKWFLSRDSMEELVEQLELVLAQDQLSAIHLVSETDCALYKELGEDDTDRYRDDMLAVADEIRGHFPEADVETFLYDTARKTLKKVTDDFD